MAQIITQIVKEHRGAMCAESATTTYLPNWNNVGNKTCRTSVVRGLGFVLLIVIRHDELNAKSIHSTESQINAF